MFRFLDVKSEEAPETCHRVKSDITTEKTHTHRLSQHLNISSLKH